MTMRHGVSCLLVLLFGAGVPAGCGRSAAPSPAATSPAARDRSVVALGDSVPHGTNCDCVPYPSLTADMLSAAGGSPVTVRNDSVNGTTTDGVLRRLTG
ncbi:hypothetical protein [Actinoplanes sp. NPDC020271]|uniref:hypothetical protein n=1 Tax=Actinoplanes sp. NPDC020271 TaxID=3363896 RepID=UPI0037A68B23